MGDPVVDIAIEPRRSSDRDRLSSALAVLANDDPDCRVRIDPESGQAILSGQDEQHLERLVWRLEAAGADIDVGAPQVAYRETITRKVEHEYVHERQSPDGAQFARIKFRIEPGDGPEFVAAVAEADLPAAFILGVQTGVASVMGSGPVIGFPIVGARFTLLNGAYHDVDSSAVAFEIAARAGFYQAIEQARPRILEPVMWVEVVVPRSVVGNVIGDLNSRRGRIERTEIQDDGCLVVGLVPVATMFGYVNSLRSISNGAGRFATRFSHYAEVPTSLDPDDRFPSAMAMRA
jgi:elongation factor G